MRVVWDTGSEATKMRDVLEQFREMEYAILDWSGDEPDADDIQVREVRASGADAGPGQVPAVLGMDEARRT